MPGWQTTEVPTLDVRLTGTTDGSLPYDKTSVGLVITNTGGHPISIERAIGVEKVVGFNWSPVMAIEAAGSCKDFDFTYQWHEGVAIDSGAELDVVPWHGWTCGSQCMAGCMKNVPVGMGTYRFALVTREGQRVLSPEFKLPSP